MKQLMFVIYDSKANAYLQPWFLTTEPMAIRAFTDLANDSDSNVSRHPEDYTLFNIGSFDDNTAEIIWNAPITLGNAIQYKTQPEAQALGQTRFTDGEDTPSSQSSSAPINYGDTKP